MADTEGRRARGRPPGAPQPYPNGPLDTWLEGLSPTAHHLLDAARDILLARGYEGLTLEAVALEAGEDPATIKRHFATKAGLIQALFDDIGNDVYEGMATRSAALPAGEQRRHAVIRSCSSLTQDRQLALGMFELAPHAIRDPILRERFAALYAWYLKTMAEDAGIKERLGMIKAYEDRRDVETLPAIVMSVIDGISLQLSLDPRSVEPDRVFALVDLFVSAVLDGTIRTHGRLGTATDTADAGAEQSAGPA